jgi:hypothetical protein
MITEPERFLNRFQDENLPVANLIDINLFLQIWNLQSSDFENDFITQGFDVIGLNFRRF